MGNTFYGGAHHHHHYHGGSDDRPAPTPRPVDTRSVWRQHPIVGTLTYAIGAGLALALVVTYWYVVLPIAVVGVAGYFGVKQWKSQRAKNSALSARAHTEHEAFLRGESRGIYGQFEPPTL